MLFSKTYPSFLTVKEGVFLKSSRPSLPLKKAPPLTPSPLSSGAREKTALQCCICPTCPSPAGGSLILNQAFPLTIKRKDVTALRCSEPLRSKVGGPKRSSPDCAGWDRLGKTGGRWFFLTHSNMFEVDICGFVIRSFHFLGKLLQ